MPKFYQFTIRTPDEPFKVKCIMQDFTVPDFKPETNKLFFNCESEGHAARLVAACPDPVAVELSIEDTGVLVERWHLVGTTLTQESCGVQIKYSHADYVPLEKSNELFEKVVTKPVKSQYQYRGNDGTS